MEGLETWGRHCPELYVVRNIINEAFISIAAFYPHIEEPVIISYRHEYQTAHLARSQLQLPHANINVTPLCWALISVNCALLLIACCRWCRCRKNFLPSFLFLKETTWSVATVGSSARLIWQIFIYQMLFLMQPWRDLSLHLGSNWEKWYSSYLESFLFFSKRFLPIILLQVHLIF